MFHSFGYRGHTIHIAIPDRGSDEEIKVQLHRYDGGFVLVPCKTLLRAKRRIARHLREQATPDQPAGGAPIRAMAMGRRSPGGGRSPSTRYRGGVRRVAVCVIK